MAVGQFIVASRTSIGRMARRAGLAIDSRKLSVKVVLPSGRVRRRTHHLMASDALVPPGIGRGCDVHGGSRQHVGVAHEALRARRRRLLGVVNAKALVVEIRFDVARMAARSRTRLLIDMASVAVGHSELRRNRLVVIMTADAIHHPRQGQRL